MGKRSSPERQIIFASLMSEEQAEIARVLAPKHGFSSKVTGRPDQTCFSPTTKISYKVPEGTVQITISGPRGVDSTPFWDELTELTNPEAR